MRIYGYSFVSGCAGNLLIAMGGASRPQIEVIKDGNFASKDVGTPGKVEEERLHCLVAVLSWEDSAGEFVAGAASSSWRVCAIQIHNDLAKKPGAMEPIAASFWSMMLELVVKVFALTLGALRDR